VHDKIVLLKPKMGARKMDENEKTLDSEVKDAQPAYDVRYTYADYLKWDDGVRRELIDGVPYLMAAPNRRHQTLSRNLFRQIDRFLEDKICEAYYAPFDVRLDADTKDDTVVQPDIVIVCDHSKLDDVGCKGSPDMVVEILSPSNSRYDMVTKFNTYLRAGIREYWILDPEARTLAVHILKDGNYITHAYISEDIVPVNILDGFSVDLSEVFEGDVTENSQESTVNEVHPSFEKRYTYADYIKWDDGVQRELIDGIIYVNGKVAEPPST